MADLLPPLKPIPIKDRLSILYIEYGHLTNLWKTVSMSEIHFIVEEAPEGGYVARAVGVDIVTEADDLPSLHAQVRDAVRCHFDEGQVPGLIRLHITREEVLAA